MITSKRNLEDKIFINAALFLLRVYINTKCAHHGYEEDSLIKRC